MKCQLYKFLSLNKDGIICNNCDLHWDIPLFLLFNLLHTFSEINRVVVAAVSQAVQLVGSIAVVECFTDKSDSDFSLFVGCKLLPSCMFIQIFNLFLFVKSLFGTHENGDVLKLLESIHWIPSFLDEHKPDCLDG